MSLHLRQLACASLLLSTPALAQVSLGTPPPSTGAHPVTYVQSAAGAGSSNFCFTMEFEGFGNFDPIGTISGPIDITFGPSWVALIDSDAGGTGNTANEPSGETVAFVNSGFAEPIDFSEGVTSVEVFYTASASSIPITISGFDGPNGTGNLIGTAVGETIGNDGSCTGDPNGTFCLFDVMTITAPGDIIRSITITGATANQFAFDDITVCKNSVGTEYCTSLPNTTGQSGLLLASGSDLAADNMLTLTAINLPPNQTGYILNSMNAATIPVASGILCLGDGKGRHTAQAMDSGLGGQIITPIDTTALPRSVGGPAAVMIGETWRFQMWHRDGTDSNFTSAVAITFQ